MICRNRERQLVMIDKALNTKTYIKILDENLLEFDGSIRYDFYAISCSMPKSSQNKVMVD